jgi:hypothetical protein
MYARDQQPAAAGQPNSGSDCFLISADWTKQEASNSQRTSSKDVTEQLTRVLRDK